MSKIHPQSPEGFEFIETPPAPCTSKAEDCGVRTTSVRSWFLVPGPWAFPWFVTEPL
jgi:hypothetical protein